MIKNIAATIALGAASIGLAAQDSDAKPLYVGFTAGFSQTDLRYYQGGKVLGQCYELGYDGTKPDSFTALRIYARYSRWTGDYIERLDVTQDLISYGAGLDFTFRTPVRGLRPYTGVMLTFWDGKRVTDSEYLGYMLDEPNDILLAGPRPEGQGKLGYRLGVSYNVWRDVSISLDFNQSQWLNESPYTNDNVISYYKVKGYNRVHPSWIGLTIKYNFSLDL
ncbi:MAG: hypothetical protein LBC63_03280 [Holophagales bacterium]|jgi:hypothetical protein|nr:hypothetical protein [Holophagales bacterium]